MPQASLLRPSPCQAMPEETVQESAGTGEAPVAVENGMPSGGESEDVLKAKPRQVKAAIASRQPQPPGHQGLPGGREA